MSTRYPKKAAKKAAKESAKKAPEQAPKKAPGKAPRRKGEDPLVAFCRALPGATEDVKWGNDIIFSVGGKMFAGFPLPGGDPIGFKVDPLVFPTLVGKNGVIPAPYMAKHSWVSVTDRSRLPPGTLEGLLAESHRLVAAGLPAKRRKALGIAAAGD